MVSNLYIDGVLSSYKNFKGTFSSDNIPLLEKNEGAICNFSKRSEVGSHFVFLFNQDNLLHYFDPLKLPFIRDDIIHYISKYTAVVDLSKRIQHYTSNFCGFYCILAFLACNIKVDFFINDILNVFENNSLENDKICVQLINSLISCSNKL